MNKWKYKRGDWEYKQGEQIKTISEFDRCESRWYILNGEVKSRGAIMMFRYRTLLKFIINGLLYRAERKEND